MQVETPALHAMGLARYIPFDDSSQSFAEDHEASFPALNLSALSPTLIDSELFGHRALNRQPG